MYFHINCGGEVLSKRNSDIYRVVDSISHSRVLTGDIVKEVVKKNSVFFCDSCQKQVEKHEII